MFEQFDRPSLGITLKALGRALLREQMHQGCSHLLSRAPGLVTLQGMPVTAVDGQQPLELLGQLAAGVRPGLRGSAPRGGSGR